MTKEEGESMKKTFKWIIITAIPVFLAVAGYFAHRQEKTVDLLLKQNDSIAELKIETATIATRQESLIGKKYMLKYPW